MNVASLKRERRCKYSAFTGGALLQWERYYSGSVVAGGAQLLLVPRFLNTLDLDIFLTRVILAFFYGSSKESST